MSLIGIVLTFVLINNFIFTKFLGLCPFVGVSKNLESAVGMGAAVTFVATVASLVTSVLWNYVLVNTFIDLKFLRTVTFILVIAALVQFVELVIQKISPSLYKALGIYLPLITTNCAVLGIAIINADSGFNVFESFVAGFSAGAGFFLAIVLMSALREKLDREWIPAPLRGLPITFISAGLMAMAFMAFDTTMLKNILG